MTRPNRIIRTRCIVFFSITVFAHQCSYAARKCRPRLVYSKSVLESDGPLLNLLFEKSIQNLRMGSKQLQNHGGGNSNGITRFVFN